MLMDISSRDFKDIFKPKALHLPIRWDGKDFYASIENLFNKYYSALGNDSGITKCTMSEFSKLHIIRDKLLASIEYYHSGRPSQAFHEFSDVMKILMENPIRIYEKTGFGNYFTHNGDPLKLFRVRNVQQNIVYKRSDVFHTPYNLRSKVATCRYSIAGFPSLYLGTSLELCLEESQKSTFNELQIASRFEMVRDYRYNDTSIKVIEIAIKPQDFLSNDENNDKDYVHYLSNINLNSYDVRSAYIAWYPLIAACSFIRVSKADPFASEYIIPQLLMQWIRRHDTEGEFYGIRYFSCASVRASEMGFNYVFPVSGNKYRKNRPHCEILAKSFKLTDPRFLHEYSSIDECERALINDKITKHI